VNIYGREWKKLNCTQGKRVEDNRREKEHKIEENSGLSEKVKEQIQEGRGENRSDKNRIDRGA